MRTALVAAAVASMLGQAGAGTFAGSWTADFRGAPLVRLDIRTAAGTSSGPSGTLRIANIHVDAGGVVDEVTSGLSAPAPLIDVAVRGRTLAFARQDEHDIDRFELTIGDDGAAEVRFILSDEDRKQLADEGIPLPKPIRVTKAR